MMHKMKCDALCQHPHCWFVHEKHDVDVIKKPIKKPRTPVHVSDDKMEMPMQSIKNLLADYGVTEDLPHNSFVQGNLWKLSSSSLKQDSIKFRARNRSINFYCQESDQSASCSNIQLNIFDTESYADRVDSFSGKQYVWVPNQYAVVKRKNRLLAVKDNPSPNSTAEIDLTKFLIPLEERRNKEGRLLKSRKVHCPPNTRALQRLKSSPRIINEQNTLSRHKSTIDTLFTADKDPLRHLLFDINLRDKSLDTISLPQFHFNQRHTTELTTESLDIPQEAHLQLKYNGNYRQISSLQPITKIPSISLGLPELPSGVKITKPFSYKKLDFNFTLGPVLSGISSFRSDEGNGNTERDIEQQKEINQDIHGIESPLHPISVSLPEAASKTNKLPDRTLPTKKEYIYTSFNKSLDQQNTYENNENVRISPTPMKSRTIYSNHNTDASPDKMLETEAETFPTRPDSVRTDSTAAWPEVTEAIVEQTVSLASSKSHLKSRLDESRINGKGQYEAKGHSAELMKMNKSDVPSPAPPPPSPEPKKNAALQS